MSKQTAEVLRKARSYIERGWCQGDYGRDKFGSTYSGSPDAQAWCPKGAIAAASYGREMYFGLAVGALKIQVGYAIAEWNDMRDRTQAEVLAAFDRAIAAEEAGD